MKPRPRASFGVAIYGGSLGSRDNLYSLITKKRKPEYPTELMGDDWHDVRLDNDLLVRVSRMPQADRFPDIYRHLSGKQAVFIGVETTDECKAVGKLTEEVRDYNKEVSVYLVVNEKEVEVEVEELKKLIAKHEPISYFTYSSEDDVLSCTEKLLQQSAKDYLRKMEMPEREKEKKEAKGSVSALGMYQQHRITLQGLNLKELGGLAFSLALEADMKHAKEQIKDPVLLISKMQELQQSIREFRLVTKVVLSRDDHDKINTLEDEILKVMIPQPSSQEKPSCTFL